MLLYDWLCGLCVACWGIELCLSLLWQGGSRGEDSTRLVTGGPDHVGVVELLSQLPVHARLVGGDDLHQGVLQDPVAEEGHVDIPRRRVPGRLVLHGPVRRLSALGLYKNGASQPHGLGFVCTRWGGGGRALTRQLAHGALLT